MERGKATRHATRYQRSARRDARLVPSGAGTRKSITRVGEVDRMFIPIGLLLVLLPLCAEVVEGIVRLFVWAALSLGGAL